MRGIDKEGCTVIKARSKGTVRGIGFLFAIVFLLLPVAGAYAANMICGDCHISQHGGTTCPTCVSCHTSSGYPTAPQVAQGVTHHSGTCTNCHTAVHPNPIVPSPCTSCHSVEANAPFNHRTGTGTPSTCETCHSVAGTTYPGIIPNPLSAPCVQCHGGGTDPVNNPPRSPILWLSEATLAARANGIHQITPDLVISSLTLSVSQTWAGVSISISDETKNRGGGNAGASTTAFYLSADTTLDGGDTLLGSRAVPALVYNETSTGTTSVTIPPGTAPGTYYIIANADNGGVVTEFDETNNARVSSALTIVANNVDLVIFSVYAPGSAKKGATITLTDATKNRLTDTAAASTTAAYLSATCTTSPSGSPIGSRAVPSLAGGGISSGSISALIPAGTTAGSYYIIWKADNGGVVGETDETNNTKCKAITITN